MQIPYHPSFAIKDSWVKKSLVILMLEMYVAEMFGLIFVPLE
jgi:hypothetical protein